MKQSRRTQLPRYQITVKHMPMKLNGKMYLVTYPPKVTPRKSKRWEMSITLDKRSGGFEWTWPA